MQLKSYTNRHGSIGIVEADSTMIGSSVDIAVTRKQEYADMIVRAVNSHQALVDALTELLAASVANHLPGCPELDDANEQARQALALATK